MEEIKEIILTLAAIATLIKTILEIQEKIEAKRKRKKKKKR
ncbi:hypothetical protein GFC29_3822 (plasmid) [Anoxybacillus sp. B7M1]|nr:hypothetical protein [Anoxybacillus sp. B7M1]ANB66105.1 hypothetical protein GFC29_3822 [Anoxybacillus sp. B7M1]